MGIEELLPEKRAEMLRIAARHGAPNPIAPWELRVGEVRVFYDIDELGVVTILAIGTKRGSRFFIDGEQIDL